MPYEVLHKGLIERKVYIKLCNTLACLANTDQIPEPTCEWIEIVKSCEMSGEIHFQGYPRLPKLLREWIQGFKVPKLGTAEYEESHSAICSASQALDRLEYCQSGPQSYRVTWIFTIKGPEWKYSSTGFRWDYSSEAIDWGYNKSSMFELWLSPQTSLKPRGPQDKKCDYSDDESDDSTGDGINNEIETREKMQLVRLEDSSFSYEQGLDSALGRALETIDAQ
ncbi:hypothetical protein LTR41_002446 [Exophiala xenobiotica]|nr:hypothetical protein LTR41_002446 [Exophiala xenobiotica]